MVFGSPNQLIKIKKQNAGKVEPPLKNFLDLCMDKHQLYTLKCDCSLVVTSIRLGGFMVLRFLCPEASEDSNGRDSGLQRLRSQVTA